MGEGPKAAREAKYKAARDAEWKIIAGRRRPTTDSSDCVRDHQVLGLVAV